MSHLIETFPQLTLTQPVLASQLDDQAKNLLVSQLEFNMLLYANFSQVILPLLKYLDHAQFFIPIHLKASCIWLMEF